MPDLHAQDVLQERSSDGPGGSDTRHTNRDGSKVTEDSLSNEEINEPEGETVDMAPELVWCR